MKILLVAYACEPNRGSEPAVGWNLATDLAEQHEVWVITRSNNQPAIDSVLSRAAHGNVHFVYHDLSWALPLKRGPSAVYPYHYLWQLTVRRIAAELHRSIDFDVIHQATLGSFRYPSSLTGLGPPVVLGPLGGAEETPVSFWPGLGAQGMVFESFRWLSNRAATLDPLVRKSMRSADLVLAASPDGQRFLRRRFAIAGGLEVLPSIAVDATFSQSTDPTRTAGPPLRALFVGRLTPWKGAHLGIRALAEAIRGGIDACLTILGKGSERRRLDRMADSLQVSDRVEFVDEVSGLGGVREMYARHDVLLQPSLHEAGGMAVVEAMACGLPVICLGLGGPAMTVTHETGFPVPARSPAEAVRGMADALQTLATQSDLRLSMSRAAEARVAEFYSWDDKARRLIRLYQSLED